MYQAFMIVLRESVEAFLIVAITFSYLKKISQNRLLSAVGWGIFGAVLTSGALGYVLWKTDGANQPLWESIFGVVTVVLVGSFVVHMWKVGPELKRTMERDIRKEAEKSNVGASYFGIFIFTILMISRESMETVLLLFQIREPQMVMGVFLGILAACIIALLWQQFSYLINWNRFFQVTSVFLLLFVVQVAFQAFHEFTETGLMPQSDYWHKITEPFSTDGIYGKWYTNITFFGCGAWLLTSFVYQKLKR